MIPGVQPKLELTLESEKPKYRLVRERLEKQLKELEDGK